MNRLLFLFFAASLGASPALSGPVLDPQKVNEAVFTESALGSDGPKGVNAVVLKLQVLLDRAHYSPGVIDGRMGENVKLALSAFEENSGFPIDGKLDSEVWKALDANGAPVLLKYKLTAEDVEGPFVETIPDDYAEMAKLESLSYTGPAELLSEKFHMDVDLLKALNPEAKFETPGEEIIVADVADSAAEGEIDRIEIDKSRSTVRGYAASGEVRVVYPATIGSDGNPSPSGSMRVEGVARNPEYSYDPEEHSNRRGDEPLTLPPGPNNPVGSVWIELSRETYGIHGTPKPELIGKTASEGCVRLTNWDAEELARLVKPGTDVKFIE
jgi:lipoprotein-anchoring transpeptidase ErfK/SrfK